MFIPSGFIGIFLLMIAADALWLGFIADQFYSAELGTLRSSDVNWTAALIFYALYAGVLTILIIAPSGDQPHYLGALGKGALLGLFAYGTYNLTNLAVLNGWTVKLAIVDMIWGTLLTAFLAYAGLKIAMLSSSLFTS